MFVGTLFSSGDRATRAWMHTCGRSMIKSPSFFPSSWAAGPRLTWALYPTSSPAGTSLWPPRGHCAGPLLRPRGGRVVHGRIRLGPPCLPRGRAHLAPLDRRGRRLPDTQPPPPATRRSLTTRVMTLRWSFGSRWSCWDAPFPASLLIPRVCCSPAGAYFGTTTAEPAVATVVSPWTSLAASSCLLRASTPYLAPGTACRGALLCPRGRWFRIFPSGDD
jgi:hypothetical protein